MPYHTLLRTIATARIVLPSTIIRLAAGRQTHDESKQAMCFMAGANAVFTGEQMLTTPCECSFHGQRQRLLERHSLLTATHFYRTGLTTMDVTGSPWDEDKAMMGRWGLDGMRSFEQRNVAEKEGSRLSGASAAPENLTGHARNTSSTQ